MPLGRIGAKPPRATSASAKINSNLLRHAARRVVRYSWSACRQVNARRKIRLSVLHGSLLDPVGQKHGLVRVIDESGDDYLYPKALFRAIALPQAIKRAILTAA